MGSGRDASAYMQPFCAFSSPPYRDRQQYLAPAPREQWQLREVWDTLPLSAACPLCSPGTASWSFPVISLAAADTHITVLAADDQLEVAVPFDDDLSHALHHASCG